jgi:hypothetical protein
MAYMSLDNIIAECIREHARVSTVSRGLNLESKETLYRDSFSAINSWVESRLSKKKGAELPNLGTFTWESKSSGDGRVFSRPIFLLNDNFVKDHKVKRPRIHTTPNVAKGEEINYSKLAIKFSKSSTKDMIFNGTRDILKKIGDFVDKNFEFDVEFSFGILKCKEKKVRFEFNQARLSAILPETLRIGTMPQEQEETTNDDNNNNTSSISGNQYSARSDIEPSPRVQSSGSGSVAAIGGGQRKIPPLSLNGGTTSVSFSNISASQAQVTAGTEASTYFSSEEDNSNSSNTSTSTSTYIPPLTTTGEVGNFSGTNARSDNDDNEPTGTFVPAPDRMLSPRLVEIMREMEESLNAPPVDKITLRNNAKARVDEQAYLRSLLVLDEEAKDVERIAREVDKQIEAFEIDLSHKANEFHNKTKTINKWLTEQMDSNKKVADQKLAEKLKYQGSFFLPENAGNVLMPSGSLPGGLHKTAIKEGLRKDLKYQIRNNMEKKFKEKIRNEEEERDYLDHVAMEMDLDAIEVRAKHLEQQKILLESWERDAHVKNLKKLQVGGTRAVNEYLNINLPDAVDANSGTIRKTDIKTSFGSSIGYDTRKGRT